MSHVDISERAFGAIFLGIVVYFGLVIYGSFANEPLATLAAEFVFGVIAIGLGTLLYAVANATRSVLFGAAIALVAGGVLQFGYLLSHVLAVQQASIIDHASSIAVFVGIGLYVYAVWFDER
ncbi:hypothetical protein EA462_11075 [Natrarchaeobius halalkaliphilus]|uniref:Uncharacterized protein n=1 Tax=Natrarchaeobius halalkaliphilus TaxID=1679091 RepID=A0A3N6LK32_9EURY|nr:hypothetical protein [Natrarchaeobius halalkaliphilus]RQG88928.1 hypothetical protein EA462_11075 [Natrarchaeobius halalkaliphilus]